MPRHSGDKDPKETAGSQARAFMSDAEAQRQDEQFQPPTPEQIAADVKQVDDAYKGR